MLDNENTVFLIIPSKPWIPTHYLRQIKRIYSNLGIVEIELQQKWVTEFGGEEWRPVEIIEEDPNAT